MAGSRAGRRGAGKEELAPGTWPPDAQARPRRPEPFIEGGNEFALAQYGQLRQTPGNLFFSPFSIRTALAMTYAGARGETAEQMAEALRFSVSNEALHAAFGELIRRLNAAGGRSYELAAANSLWAPGGAPLVAAFVDFVARLYGGGLHLVDSRRGAEAARMTINRWAEDRTKRKIQELIPPGGLNTRLVLVNAVYKGMWELQFHKAATRPEPFYLEGGGAVPEPLMHQEEVVQYLEADGYQAVDLAYRGEGVSMLVLLPKRKDGLQDLEGMLSAPMLRDCAAQMSVRTVKLLLPRFTLTWGSELLAPLTALGMPLAFERFRADFSGINNHPPPHEESLVLSAVFHKAFGEVNEEGTEAAAATAVPMMAAGALPMRPPPVPVFRADHPFPFAIRDRRSGAILFLGRMADPTS